MTRNSDKLSCDGNGLGFPNVPRNLLQKYDKIKLELAGLIRETIGPAGTDERLREEGTELLSRLAEDRFNVAVVGRFSRGKTSLMNAVLGADRLPTGILPLTSVITVVRYGSKEQALVHYVHGSLPQEISLDQLPDFVTQEGNPGNSRGVESVEVQIPSETLLRGFSFVDTPGLGSPVAESASETYGFFPEMDAVVLVTSFEAALSAEEVEFLRQAVQGARKTFLVVNKLDLVSGEEREKVMRHVEERLSREVGRTEIGVFAVSARDGLDAKLRDNANKLQKSGLPLFEEALVRFLTAEKSLRVLDLTCRRLLDLATVVGIPPLSAIPKRVREIQGEFLAHGAPQVSSGGPPATVSYLRSEQTQLKMDCRICGEMVSRVFDFFAQYQNQLSTSRETQATHAANGGFCPMHTWQYEKIASPRGICASYAAFLDNVAGELRGMLNKAESVEDILLGLANLAESHPRCKACEVQHSTEEDALTRLSSLISGRWRDGARDLPVLCLLHLPPFLARIPDPELIREMIGRQADICERVSENMQRQVLKFDARRRALLSDEERTAHLHGLMILAGHRRVAAAGIETEDLWRG